MQKKTEKLAKKNKPLAEALNSKVEEILQNPYHYKPLRSPMEHMRRVHILKSFVLIFSIDEKNKTVILQNLAHHDEAYH
ncbi:MAG: type II toxin-antitoxin system RelE/ParE family toxin [Candidatus Aenigmatarchaeota archaeon]